VAGSSINAECCSFVFIKISSSSPCEYLAFSSPSAPQGLYYLLVTEKKLFPLVFGAVKLKLKFVNAQQGIFQFIPPKAALRYWGLKVRTNGGASILRPEKIGTAKDESPTLQI